MNIEQLSENFTLKHRNFRDQSNRMEMRGSIKKASLPQIATFMPPARNMYVSSLKTKTKTQEWSVQLQLIVQLVALHV